VSSHRSHLALHVAHSVPVLGLPEREHFIARATAASLATVAAMDHAPTAYFSHGPCPTAWPRAGKRPITVQAFFFISNFLFQIKDFRNLFKILKFIENKIKLEKVQNKFLYNPCE
jgi:hypothetical protein